VAEIECFTSHWTMFLALAWWLQLKADTFAPLHPCISQCDMPKIEIRITENLLL
jgi:hypothetical protein